MKITKAEIFESVKDELKDMKRMLKDNNISFDKFYSFLREKELGDWDRVNNEEILKQYIKEMVEKGIHISHIVKSFEENKSEQDLYCIWLGNSMETPIPINTKQDLINALQIEVKK